jgi:branched-chain amino acid transport system permease protein
MKATGVFNLLQGAFVLFGAYLTYDAHITFGLPFPIGIGLAIIVCAGGGILLDRYVFARVTSGGNTGSGLFAVLLLAIGILTIAEALVVAVWGPLTLSLNDPWALNTVTVAGVSLTTRDLSVIAISLVLLAAFWYLIARTRIGIAMRAMASDPEAARAQGINPNVVSAVAWGCAAVAGVLAGIMLGTEVGGGVTPTLDQVAFAALPALILGGADSLVGCVAGGVVLGLLQSYGAGYAPAGLGQGFSEALPWMILILILVIRPTGLFGSREIRRA